MALTVKNLGAGTLGTSISASTTAGDIATPSAAGKSILIKNVILVNKTSSSVVLNNFAFVAVTGSPVLINLLPPNTSIPAYCKLVLDEEISLQFPSGGTQEKLKANAASGTAIDFVVNGLERDL